MKTELFRDAHKIAFTAAALFGLILSMAFFTGMKPQAQPQPPATDTPGLRP